MSDRPGATRRVVPIVLRILIPLLMTTMAGFLGYALAVYPIWHHVEEVRRTETLGGFIPSPTVLESMLNAYYPDDELDVASFENIVWAVPTVMTPFVGYGAAPGRWHNTVISPQQFRGGTSLVLPKPPGVTRIFLTGASVAFSAGAPSDDRTIGAYLQRLLDARGATMGTRFEVFTFATPAWSSTHERIGIENHLSELAPDLVISLTGVADSFYGERGHNVLWARALTDQFYWDLVNVALERAGFPHMVDVQDAGPNPVPPEVVAARLRKNVLLGAAALALSGARYHVFLQPAIVTTGKPLGPRETRWTRSGYFKDPKYYRECYADIDAVLRESDLPENAAYTNISGIFDDLTADQDIFLDSYHFGDRGNDLIAQGMAQALLAPSGPLAGAKQHTP